MPAKPTPPARKVTNAASADAICQRMDREDEVASFNRAGIKSMFDGEVPFNVARRAEQGLEELANINFLGAQAKLRDGLAAYVDLIDSPEHLAEFVLDLPDDTQKSDAAFDLKDKFKWLNGEWDFANRVMRVASGFIQDGVSVGYWDNPWNFQWDAARLANFTLPRGTKVGEEHIKLARFRDEMDVDDLWEKIQDPKEGRRRGWNITECQKQIAHADKGWDGRTNWRNNWEKFVEMQKENGYCGYSSYHRIPVNKLLSKEANGSYSLHIVAAHSPTEFLYRAFGRFEDISQLLVTFTSAVGDHYHEIRGMGYDIFPFEQAINRLNCKLLDGTALAGSIVAQPKDPQALENFQMQSVGGFMVVQGDVTFPSITSSNVATQVLPVIDAMSRMLQNNTGRYQSRSITPDGSSERTLGEVKQQVAKESVLSTSEMILFYWPMRRIYREMVRRLFNPSLTQRDPGGKLAFEFRKKLIKAGVTEKIWSKIEDVKPIRAIGNGSPQQRESAADRILSLSPQYDEVGRQIALLHATAATPGVGFQMAKQFVRPPGERPPPDVEIAGLQNVSFGMGIPQPVLGTDNHWIHASICLDYLDTVAQMVQKGQIDLATGVQTLNIGLQHVYQHYEPLSQDTGRQPEAKAIHKKMQNVGMVAQQQGQKLEKQRRQAAEQQQSQPQNGSATDPMVEQKLRHTEALFQQEQRHKEEQQALLLRTEDLKSAQKLTLERINRLDKANGN